MVVTGLSAGAMRTAYCVVRTDGEHRQTVVNAGTQRIGRAPAVDLEDAKKRMYGHGTLLAVVHGRWPPDLVIVGRTTDPAMWPRDVYSDLFRGVASDKIVWASESGVLQALDDLYKRNAKQLCRQGLGATVNVNTPHRLHAALAALAGVQYGRLLRLAQ